MSSRLGISRYVSFHHLFLLWECVRRRVLTNPPDYSQPEEGRTARQADCLRQKDQGKRDFGEPRESQILRAVCEGRGSAGADQGRRGAADKEQVVNKPSLSPQYSFSSRGRRHLSNCRGWHTARLMRPAQDEHLYFAGGRRDDALQLTILSKIFYSPRIHAE